MPESPQPIHEEQKLSRELTSIESDYLTRLTKELYQITGNKSLLEITEEEYNQYSTEVREKMIKLSTLIKDLVEGNKEELKERAREETIQWLNEIFNSNQEMVDEALVSFDFDQAPLVILKGSINISNPSVSSLPKYFQVDGDLRFNGSDNLTEIGGFLVVKGNLNLANSLSLTRLNGDIEVKGDLFASGCFFLETPTGQISVGGNLNFAFCSSLEELPANIQVKGGINLYNCQHLSRLPDNLKVTDELRIGRCPKLKLLPANLHVLGDLHLEECLIEEANNDFIVEGNLWLSGSDPVLVRQIRTHHRQQIKGNIIYR